MTYNIEVINDKKIVALLTAAVPVLEDLRAIMGNWNGDEPGKDEDQSNLAKEAFDQLSGAIDTIRELNK